MIRCMNLERKAHEHGGYGGRNLCSRRFVSLTYSGKRFDIFWKTELIGKLYYVRSDDENVGGSVVDIFWITDVLVKLYSVRSTEENVVGSVVHMF